MAEKRPKRPRDLNQWAKHMVETATGQVASSHPTPDSGKNPAAVALGRRGGLKGGKARAEKLSANEREKIAKKAAEKRWGKRGREGTKGR